MVCTLPSSYFAGLTSSACAMPEAVAEHGAGSEEWRTQIAAAAVEAALGASKELSLEREHALQAAEARALAAEEAASQLQERGWRSCRPWWSGVACAQLHTTRTPPNLTRSTHFRRLSRQHVERQQKEKNGDI